MGAKIGVKPLEWVEALGYAIRCADENGWKWTTLGVGAYSCEDSPKVAKLARQLNEIADVLDEA